MKRLKFPEPEQFFIGLIAIAIIGIIVIIFVARWENRNSYYEDNWQSYEVVIVNDHEVTLYRSDLKDSILMRMENPYILVGEQVIQINKPIKKLP